MKTVPKRRKAYAPPQLVTDEVVFQRPAPTVVCTVEGPPGAQSCVGDPQSVCDFRDPDTGCAP